MIEVTEPMRIMVRNNLKEFGYNVTRELVNETIDGLISNPTETPLNGIIGMFTKDMLVKAGIVNDRPTDNAAQTDRKEG